MTTLYLVSFPMSRRKDANSFVRDIKGKKFHVNENGLGSSIDIYVVCPRPTLTKITSRYGLTPNIVPKVAYV